MKLLNRSLFNSLRFKLVTGLMLIMIPMVSFLIYNNLYSIDVVRNQVAQSNSNMLNLYMGLIDTTLEDIDSYMLKFTAEESGLNILDSLPEADVDLYNLQRIWLFTELRDNATYYKALDYFFIYSPLNQDLLFAPKLTGSAYTNNDFIKEGIVALLNDEQAMKNYQYDKWSVLNLKEQNYLLHMIKAGNLYIGAGVNVDGVMDPLDFLDLGSEGRSLLVDESNRPLQDEDFFEKNKIDLSYISKTYQLSGEDNNYLVMGEKSGKGEFGLVAVVPEQNILEKLPYLQRIIVLIATGSILILVIALYFLRKVVLLPINRIIVAMRKIKEGYMEARIPNKPTSNEFEMMNETFNSMVCDIQQLKIDVYEEQLINQKAELKQLQLQINPHFFLNSLNIVYYLAQEKKYELIQELSLSLIRYFRFMFRSQTDYVLLQDELNHSENYLKIQTFRFPGSFTYDIAVDGELRECYIPPLIIQSFAENTIKHAINTDEPTHIAISIGRCELMPEERLRIQIHDTGRGFSEEVLQKLQQEINLMNEDGEHIGIWNVRRRLRLLYGDKASMAFYNEDGAAVEITMPLTKEMRS
ncbi:two-component sensor histidine kinase [Paenibacillus sp. FSL A5-0031]|uniref:sensor histidine kinase n=2 Tax=unclassified Paenibacillus TaxID=185978 RepID=UPI00096C91E9|nr:histidine kinase [Paenibacillus sp. FSL A5-0031]OME86026.1 two-component sensor histidine kinase [Paenibacillus sp. FSL A5-0031]